MNILIIVAHPDDEVLGMGGTIAKHTKNGDKVKIVYLSTGITARKTKDHKNSTLYSVNKTNESVMNNEIKSLRNDAKKSCSILGVKNFSFYDFPDNEMDSIPLLKIVKTIEFEIKKSKPDRIYTSHYGDLNIDHKVVFNATLTACRPGIFNVKELLTFEILSSTEWAYPVTFSPNYFVNISNQITKKISSMRAYKNEIKKFPHPRSIENLKFNAGKWGSVSGNKSAEAFEVIRMIIN